MGTTKTVNPSANHKGYIASGMIELWVFEDKVRAAHFRDKHERRKITERWMHQLSIGTHPGTYYVHIILDDKIH